MISCMRRIHLAYTFGVIFTELNVQSRWWPTYNTRKDTMQKFILTILECEAVLRQIMVFAVCAGIYWAPRFEAVHMQVATRASGCQSLSLLVPRYLILQKPNPSPVWLRYLIQEINWNQDANTGQAREEIHHLVLCNANILSHQFYTWL